MLTAVQLAGQSIDMNSAVSLTLLLTIIGAVWSLARFFGRIERKLDKLRHVPAHISHIERFMIMQEEDMNNIFGSLRAGVDVTKLHDLTRRTRYIPYAIPEDEQ